MTTIFFTNTGTQREFNEDAILAGGLYGDVSMPYPMLATNPDSMLAVADGMGGGPGGALAARVVLEQLAVLARETGEGKPHDLILEALFKAVNRCGGFVGEAPELNGMGATVAGLWFMGESAVVFNCGDCRVYRLRHGFLEMLSRDHSIVYGLYLDGRISFEEMRTHPERHLITSAIQQANYSIELHTRIVRVDAQDVFFICSDGVWESVNSEFMEDCLSEMNLEIGALSMAESLLKDNCGDNFSFLLHGPGQE